MNLKLFAKLWRKIGKTVAIVFLIGLLLTLFVDVIKQGISVDALCSAVSHIGMALMIAGVVGICIELTEFQDLIEKRITRILFGDEYVDILSPNDLKDKSVQVMNAIGKKSVTNPDYEYQDFTRTIGRDLLDTIGTIYRKGFTNVIYFQILKDNEKAAHGASPETLSGDDIVCIDNKTKYFLEVPHQNDEQTFNISVSYKCFGPSELLRKFKFDVFVNDVPLDEIHGKKPTSEYCKVNGESLEFDFQLTLKPDQSLRNASNEEEKVLVGFEPAIEYRRVSYEYDPGSLNNYMGMLTHQINVIFSSREEVKPNIEFFGFNSSPVPTRMGNLVSVNNPDWGLAEDGYFISWQRKTSKPAQTMNNLDFGSVTRQGS